MQKQPKKGGGGGVAGGLFKFGKAVVVAELVGFAACFLLYRKTNRDRVSFIYCSLCLFVCLLSALASVLTVPTPASQGSFLTCAINIIKMFLSCYFPGFSSV